MSIKYSAGEAPEPGDRVRCLNDSASGGELKKGRDYDVVSQHDDGTIDISTIGICAGPVPWRWGADRFYLLYRKQSPRSQ